MECQSHSQPSGMVLKPVVNNGIFTISTGDPWISEPLTVSHLGFLIAQMVLVKCEIREALEVSFSASNDHFSGRQWENANLFGHVSNFLWVFPKIVVPPNHPF